MDEITLTLHPSLSRCWMKKGQQKRIPAAGQQQWHSLFGAYHWQSDKIQWRTSETANTDSFILFLEHFMKQVESDKPIVMVLDNASYHHSQGSLLTARISIPSSASGATCVITPAPTNSLIACGPSLIRFSLGYAARTFRLIPIASFFKSLSRVYVTQSYLIFSQPCAYDFSTLAHWPSGH